MKSHPRETINTHKLTELDYEHAFSDDARKTYARIMSEIQRELTTTGNINTLDVVHSTEDIQYKYAKTYAENLFSSKKYIKFIDKWARHAIPNALLQTKETLTYIETVNLGYGNKTKR